MKTAFSRILEINDHLEIGLKFPGSLGSRLFFFNSGCTTACLKPDGTTPVYKEQFTIANTIGERTSKTSLKRRKGIISKGQQEGLR